MATLDTGSLSLLDIVKRQTPDNKGIDKIVEILNDRTEILADAQWVECNNGTNNRITMRTGIPAPTYRKYNQGVQPTKSTTVQVDDTTSMLEAFTRADAALIDMSGNPGEARLSEVSAHLEGIAQQLASDIFYGDTNVNPERFLGIAPRYNVISTDDTQSGYNIIDAGGTGSDNSSMWLITWGPNSTFMIYPQGSQGGVSKKDLTPSEPDVHTFSDGAEMLVYRDHFKVTPGMCVKDWRSNARIANLDVSEMAAGTVVIEDNMIKALHRIKKGAKGQRVFYCNEATYTALDIRAKAQTVVGGGLSHKPFGNEEVLMFRGVPIRLIDLLLENEARITA